ncbi:MAG TPA: ABC transporter permease [Pseudomonadales bacterium]|nr:ABC transporter permease [Pseudomonadales bacterium]
MSTYLIKRLLMVLPTVFGAVTLVFFAIHLAPGDPIALYIPPDFPVNASPERIAELRARLGLDRPLHVQYASFIAGIFQGDLGTSLQHRNPVAEGLLDRLPNTLQLGVLSLAIAVVLGVTVGVVSAVRRGTWLDNVAMTLALFGVSIPNFWLGMLLMQLVGLHWPILPPSGFGGSIFTAEGLRYALLPAITIGISGAGGLARYTRSSMLDVLNEDYVRTARSKGLSERLVVYKHALRNALIPIITLLGLSFGSMLSGAVIVETVFGWPGLGRYLVTGISNRDFPVVQGVVLIIAVGFVMANLITDLVYGFVDPRIRYE